ncbi:hypothetical protein BD413DRAFT_70356 [Trametes elegans]|nr:hypothetical protein BD413DRAFT_70356 [Trametes elegans]
MSLESVSLETLVGALRPAIQRDLEMQSRSALLRTEAILSDALLHLRYRLNVLTAVDRLPPEILHKIFEHVAYAGNRVSRGGGMYFTQKRKKRVPARHLLDLTHVCKRWRDIALSGPRLWTNIDDHKLAQRDAFLHRSGQLPITLHLHTKRSAQCMKQILRDHAHRLRRLDITVHSEADHDTPPLQDLHVPHLECLTVVSESRLPDLDREIMPPLFDQRVSDLKALGMSCIQSWLPGNHFPRLTHLYLTNFSGRIVVSDALLHLTSLLANTPAVQYLHIGGLSRNASGTSAQDTVPLHALKTFTCTTSYAQPAIRLLSLLDLPRDVVVRLDKLECLEVATVTLAHPIPSTAFLHSLNSLEVVTENEELHLIAQGPRSGLWIQAECFTGDWFDWLSRLDTLFPLPSVTTLQASAVDEGIMPALLRQFPLLTELRFCLKPEEDFPSDEVLRRLYGALAAPGPHSCPRLETLKVDVNSDNVLFLGPTPLLAMATARAALGRPLRTVHIGAGAETAATLDEDAIRTALGPIEARLVEDVRIVRDWEVCSWVMDRMWQTTSEAERYWRLPSAEKASYELP